MSRSVETRLSAPGKLYLFGEYAVLGGAWSMVAAVERRVYATRFEAPTSYAAEGLEDPDDSFVEAILEEVERATGRRYEAGQFASDVRQMYERGTKLGLGSSAASAVALAAVGLVETGGESMGGVCIDDDMRREVISAAERAHAAFQGGVGSGGAIAAASLGGHLACRRRGPTAEFPELSPDLRLDPSVETEAFRCADLAVPEGVEIGAVWLGSPASTTDFVQLVVDHMQSEPAIVRRRLEEIAETAESAIRAARRDSSGAFVEAVEAADRAMEELGRTCEMPIVVDAHVRLREIASEYGLVAKPSGAGGGDVSLVVGPTGAAWSKFREALPAELHQMDIVFGAQGLRVEPPAASSCD